MSENFEFAARLARLRAPLFATLILALTACDTSKTLDPESSALPETASETGAAAGVEVVGVDALDIDATVDPDGAAAAEPVLASAQFAGGIPFGTFAHPTTAFGTVYNGGMRNIYPQYLLSHLSSIRNRGGKVVLNLSGGPARFKDSKGHFSMAKWKVSVDRFRKVNFSSYINSGTIIAHYLLDEPSDRANWNGKVVTPAQLEEMARYSKQLWPNMPTTVRTYPEYLAGYNGRFRYLDAAWAQYVYRHGDVGAFIRKNISVAQKEGLALIVGLNILRGGPNKTKMTPTQVKSWGAALMNTTYPCAFISWQYNSTYLASRSIRSAMQTLQAKARNRPSRSCRS